MPDSFPDFSAKYIKMVTLSKITESLLVSIITWILPFGFDFKKVGFFYSFSIKFTGITLYSMPISSNIIEIFQPLGVAAGI